MFFSNYDITSRLSNPAAVQIYESLCTLFAIHFHLRIVVHVDKRSRKAVYKYSRLAVVPYIYVAAALVRVGQFCDALSV